MAVVLIATMDTNRYQGWNIYLNGKLMDRVWFDSDMGYDEVKRALIDHDGLNPSIQIRKVL
jgi:hypothetical protein